MVEGVTITDIVQGYHDDGFDDRHAREAAAGVLLYDLCEKYGLEYPDGTLEDNFAKLMYDPIAESVDWEKIADDDENAREYDEAKREAMYK